MSATRGMLPALERLHRGRSRDTRAATPSPPPASARTRLSASICTTSRRAAGAERGADRDLALAHRGAHEQQVGDVRARDQDDDADRGEQRQQRRPDAADDLLVQPRRLRPIRWRWSPGTARASRSAIVFISARACSSETPGFQPRDRRRESARRAWRWPDRSRSAARTRSSRDGKQKPAGMTPTTVDRLAAQRDVRPSTAGSPPKRRCHMPVADDDRRCSCRARPLGAEARGRAPAATRSRSNMSHDTAAPAASLGPLVADVGRAFAVERRDRARTRCSAAASRGSSPARRRTGRIAARPRARAPSASGLGIRQRPQQHAVDDAEDRAGGADAERERQDGDEREAGRARELPDRVARVANHVDDMSEHSWLSVR